MNKTHEKALELGRKLIERNPELTDWVISKFPELKERKENEDTRIRKEILEFLKANTPYATSWISWLEKPVNQKTTESTESKFKVGDWITDGKYTWKITVVELLDYILQSQDGVTVDDTISHVDEHFQLWTIKDAKQGDVLTDGDPFIYKGLNDELHPENPVAYCGIDDSGIFKSSTENKWWTEDPVYPATKKQCERLFSKMKKAGYKWDAEKKELRKIEQKSSEWSEEDRKMLNACLSFIDTHRTKHPLAMKAYDWLKSIEPNHWKPSEYDISLLEEIARNIRNNVRPFCSEVFSLEDLIENLKKL